MSRKIIDVQRDFALASGWRSQIWDSYAADQCDILKEKIQILLPNTNTQNNNKIEQRRKLLFEKIWMQRKYTNGTLLSNIIYIMVTDELDAALAKYSTKFSQHAIFRTRKCFDSQNCNDCCIFIDEAGRVYTDWNHFVKTNILPKGSMVAPANGFYALNDNNAVLLDTHLTPAAKTLTKLLHITDKATTVGGLVAAVPLTTAFILPVAAPVMLAVTATTFATATYSVMRSSMQLTDRGSHQETLSLADSNARSNWLGIAAGTAGLLSFGATKAVSLATKTGREVSLGVKIAANSANITSVFFNGTDILHNVYSIFLGQDDRSSSMDLMHCSTSFLIFTHSINNIQIVNRAMNGNNISIRVAAISTMRELFEKMKINKFGSMRILNDIPPTKNLSNLLREFSQNTVELGAGQSCKFLLSMLPDSIISFISGNKNFNIESLAKDFGSKFVRHVINPGSLRELLTTMTKFLCSRVIKYFLDLSRTYIDIYVDKFDHCLKTIIPTENIIYIAIKISIDKYKSLNFNILKAKENEILNYIDHYFNSLNPINNGATRISCKKCYGYFIEAVL